jgi:hypothetical protein
VNWTKILQAWGGILIGSSVLGYVFRSLWSQWLSRDIEEYKAQLRHQSDLEIERFKGELQRVAFEHQTRYSRLHEKRADALEELFKRMVKANDAFATRFRAVHFAGEPSIEEQTKLAGEAANAFLDWFAQNRLFIDNSIADKILLVNRQFQSAWMTIGLMPDPKERHRVISEFFEKTPALLDEIREKILDLLSPPRGPLGPSKESGHS